MRAKIHKLGESEEKRVKRKISIKKNVSIDTLAGDAHRSLRDADDDNASGQVPKPKIQQS